jgi:predicted ATPase
MSNNNNLKFTINNFRIFDKPHTFELAPITILTGPNNSGKSSLVKALLMLKNDRNGEDIPFQINLPNRTLDLPNAKDLLNKEDESFEFKFPFGTNDENKFGLSCYNLVFILSLNRHGDSSLFFDSFKIERNNKVVLDIVYDEYYNFELTSIFNFRFWLEYERKSFIFQKGLKDFGLKGYMNNIALYEKKYGNILLFGIEHEDELLGDISPDTNLKFIEIQNQIIDSIYEINENNFDKEFKDLLIGIWEINYTELGINIRKSDSVKSTFINRFDMILLYFQFELLKQINYLPGNFKLKKTEFYFHFEKFGSSLIDNLADQLSEFTDIEVLPVSKGNSSRNFQPDDFNLSFISKMAMKIYKSSEHSKIGWFLMWVDKWLGRFELGKSLKIKNIEKRDIYTIEIIDFNDESRNIKDLGFGVSQIISLLLSPFNANFKHDESYSELKWELIVEKFEYYDKAPVFYLEEPESNLHPNWQSLLMELITEINQKFGIRFIIETHSEYMIRKLQNLVSKKIINKEEVKIYYFNSNKHVTKEEPKVKEMILREDGILATSFGPGFFDEAVKLTVELLKIENYN